MTSGHRTDPPPPFRATHRLTFRETVGSESVVVELALIDGVALGPDGAEVATLIDGRWYWLDGPAPAWWEILGMPGRRPRGDEAATRQIKVRFAAGDLAIRVTESEYEELLAGAGGLDLGPWIRDLAGGSPVGGARRLRELALATARKTA